MALPKGRNVWYGIAFIVVLLLCSLPFMCKPSGYIVQAANVSTVHTTVDTTNIRIQQWANYYRTHPTVLNRAKRSFYYNRIRQMFLDNGFSEESATVYADIPSIESNWYSKARSKAGAIGIWQQMPSLAADYGRVVDELYDPEYATQLAINHIHDLDSLFEHDIAKVLFSYNGGLGLVNSQLKEFKTNDAWLIPFERRETYDFAPKVLGAHLVLQDK